MRRKSSDWQGNSNGKLRQRNEPLYCGLWGLPRMKRIVSTGLSVLALAGAGWAQLTLARKHTAKIVLEDGTPLTGTPEVIPTLNREGLGACFSPGYGGGSDVAGNGRLEVFGNGTVEYVVRGQSNPGCVYSACLDGEAGDSCPVRIRLAGYRTTEATLRQDAVIVLKRVGDNEGTSVSITAVNAPKEAKKAYDSGVAALSHKKFDAAQKDFKRCRGLPAIRAGVERSGRGVDARPEAPGGTRRLRARARSGPKVPQAVRPTRQAGPERRAHRGRGPYHHPGAGAEPGRVSRPLLLRRRRRSPAQAAGRRREECPQSRRTRFES